jgi:hypothetical protein
MLSGMDMSSLMGGIGGEETPQENLGEEYSQEDIDSLLSEADGLLGGYNEEA